LLRLFALQDKKSISPIRTRRDIKQALRQKLPASKRLQSAFSACFSAGSVL
jgi:hypothetical protein